MENYNEELRINKGLVAEDAETKKVFDDFKTEVEAYNNNREGNLGDILSKFDDTFEVKDINDNSNDNNVEDIKKSLNEKIKELDNQVKETKTVDGITSNIYNYKTDKYNDNSIINNPTKIKIIIQSGLGLQLLSFIKRNNEIQLIYLDNETANIEDLDTKFVSTSKQKYENFILKLNDIIKNWNKVYIGEQNNWVWMLSIYNEENKNYRAIGSGSFPINWNDYIDLISDYEIEYKKLFNNSSKNIDEKFKITTKEADELLNIIDKKLEELNKKEEIENMIDNNINGAYRLANPEIFKEMYENKSINDLIEVKKDLEEKIANNNMVSLNNEYLKIINDLIAKKQNQ